MHAQRAPQHSQAQSGRRVVLHRLEVDRVRRELFPHAEPHAHNLRIGQRMVLVRVSTAARKQHNVLVRGKRYSYLRTGCSWALHMRGRKVPRPWMWVLVAHVGRERRVWVVPGHKLKGATYSLFMDRGRPRGAILDQYEQQA